MSHENKNTFNNLKQRAFKAAAIGATATVALVAVEHFKGQEPQAGHDKVYIAHAGDTEWSLARRAYPNQDPRDVIGIIQSQESPVDRPGHTLQPGEKIYFAEDSQLGTEVQAGTEALSGR